MRGRRRGAYLVIVVVDGEAIVLRGFRTRGDAVIGGDVGNRAAVGAPRELPDAIGGETELAGFPARCGDEEDLRAPMAAPGDEGDRFAAGGPARCVQAAHARDDLARGVPPRVGSTISVEA